MPGSGDVTLTRRFHVGDLLALVTGEEGASPRGLPGFEALSRYMTRYAAFAVDDTERTYRALRDAVLDAYPELGAYTAADVPPPELVPAWRRRRAAEFGRYLVAPVLPPTHWLLTEPAERRAIDPSAARRAKEDQARMAAEARAAGGGAEGEGGAEGAPARRTGAADLAPEPPSAAVGPAAPTGLRRRRRFHVGDLLAVTTRRPDIARRGDAGIVALVRYMADRPLSAHDVQGRGDEFRAVLLAAYPELGAYTEADVPPRELVFLWLRRREHEFGRYLPAPMLPSSHPLRRGVPRAET